MNYSKNFVGEKNQFKTMASDALAASLYPQASSYLCTWSYSRVNANNKCCLNECYEI